MKKILKSLKGVSLLEGLIALLLLAIVATGTFGVLLSTSRKSAAPDIREEMALAVEKAQQMLQVYVYSGDASSARYDIGTDYADGIMGGLCGDEAQNIAAPLATGTHDISCLLPPICDKNNNSEFSYTVSRDTSATDLRPRAADLSKKRNSFGDTTSVSNARSVEEIRVQFAISCNGYTL
ncbi:MAG: hypothetical protein IJ311_02145 [Elusimicrobiaceae bacterium]|nr:hypothetical protein [Elusimicrobiaceae bacterium]